MLRGLPRRALLAGLAMGAIGYAAQSGLFFGALERMDASLLALILYVYPATVLLAAVALGRERATPRRVVALIVALAGITLVLGSAASGGLDALGAAMGLGAALTYTAYILAGDRVGAGVPPLALAALVCCGATLTFGLASIPRGGPDLALSADGWLAIAGIVVVSTVGAILLFFAGLARVGPSAASILSTLEPVVTVGLAAAAFGESLSPLQLLGGALVLSAVVVMQWPARAGVAPSDGVGALTAATASGARRDSRMRVSRNAAACVALRLRGMRTRAERSTTALRRSLTSRRSSRRGRQLVQHRVLRRAAAPERDLRRAPGEPERDREVGRQRIPLADVADERAALVLPDDQPRDGRAEEVARVRGQLEQQPRLGAGRQRRLAEPRGGAVEHGVDRGAVRRAARWRSRSRG